MSKETQKTEYFFKLLSVLFLAYVVLQSIAGKPCYCCFSNCASADNLVYEVGEQGTQIDDAVAENDHFYFLKLSKKGHSPLSLCGVILIKLKPCRHSPLMIHTLYPPALRLCPLSTDQLHFLMSGFNNSNIVMGAV